MNKMDNVLKKSFLSSVISFVLVLFGLIMMSLSLLFSMFKGYGRVYAVGVIKKAFTVFNVLSWNAALSLAVGILYLITLILVIKKLTFAFGIVKVYIRDLKGDTSDKAEQNFDNLTYIYNYIFKWYITNTVVISLAGNKGLTTMGKSTLIICIIIFGLSRIAALFVGKKSANVSGSFIYTLRMTVVVSVVLYILPKLLSGHWILTLLYVDTDIPNTEWMGTYIIFEKVAYIVLAFSVLSACLMVINEFSKRYTEDYTSSLYFKFKRMSILALVLGVIKFFILYKNTVQKLEIGVRSIISAVFYYTRNDLFPIVLIMLGCMFLFKKDFPIYSKIEESTKEKNAQISA